MNIIDFATDPAILNLSLSLAQRTLLKSFYGEELSEDEIAIFRECVGREYEPREYSELTCIAGARSGKGRVARGGRHHTQNRGSRAGRRGPGSSSALEPPVR